MIICMIMTHYDTHIFNTHNDDDQGVRRRKVCFTVDDPEVCLVGLEAIVRDGQYVGHVRRGDTGYYLDTEIAYGYVSHPM